MKKISLIVVSLLLVSNLSAQNSFDEAVKGGTVSGDITLYGIKQNNSGANEDAGFTMGSIGLGYETGEFYGFKATVGFRGNHDFSEVENGDYSDGNEPRAIMHTANISYTDKYFGLTVGRQEIDLEWMADFHEAAVLGITAIANTTVVLGVTRRVGVADADAPLEKFTKFDTDENAYVLDVKYKGVEGLVVNPYFYDAKDLAKWYGLKVDYDTDMFGLTVHGAKSDLDNQSEDGQVIHLEARANIVGLGLTAGYVTTDNDQGVGAMDTLGDNINPFDRLRGGDGNYVYDTDADTSYLNLEYEIAGFELGAIYGQTKYAGNKEKELDLTVDYGITQSLSVGLLYVDVDAQNSDDDYNKVTLTLEYSF